MVVVVVVVLVVVVCVCVCVCVTHNFITFVCGLLCIEINDVLKN